MRLSRELLDTTIRMNYDDEDKSSFSFSRVERNVTDDKVLEFSKLVESLQDRNISMLRKVTKFEYFPE